ncbi:MAG TPA: DNA topoisomerase I subunit omega, partial [Gammaproteobacteria bacterium]|nr:DNA topoisomerase I subunit omega [Gammaproteobacteria bacterium]
ISNIQDRGYVSLRSRRFYAEKIGELVTDRLIENFDDLMDYSFTAEMENGLDKVASGNRDWKQMLGDFYGDFSENLVKANEAESGMRANSPTSTDIVCDKDQCGRMMQLRTASTGVFLGCSGYNLPPKERCKHTKNLISGDEAVDIDQDEDGESKLL